MANKFKEFVELVGVSKIKAADSDSEDNKASNGEDINNSDGDSDSDENNEIFATDEEIEIR